MLIIILQCLIPRKSILNNTPHTLTNCTLIQLLPCLLRYPATAPSHSQISPSNFSPISPNAWPSRPSCSQILHHHEGGSSLSTLLDLTLTEFSNHFDSQPHFGATAPSGSSQKQRNKRITISRCNSIGASHLPNFSRVGGPPSQNEQQ